MASAFAPRYAQALIDVLSSGGADLEAALGELRDFRATWDESEALRGVFVDPSIAAERKVAILDRLNERLGMTKPVRNFLAVIANHERMNGFEEIYEEFAELVRERLGIAQVEWTTARALKDGDRRAIEERIGRMTGKRIEAAFREDAALLGGARMRIGSTVYDGSVLGKLNRMREALATR